MGSNGADNAHNNAFGGGKNPGIGNTSGAGSNGSASSNRGNSNGWSWSNKPHKNDGFHSDGSYHITFHGDNNSKPKPGGNSGNRGNNGDGSSAKVREITITPDNSKPGRYISSNPEYSLLAKLIDAESIKGTEVYTFHTRKGQYVKVTVPDSNIDKMRVDYVNWKGPKYNNKLVKRFVSQFLLFRKEEKEKNEKEALLKASELVSGMGDKLGEYLGEKYKNVAKEVAGDIKNFHGRNIRSYNEAMASLNKVLANPKMKVNKSDKDAIVNAWKQVNAQDMANKIGNLGKVFKVADLAIKVEKIREKSIEGYNTGNWGPLLLEVESWIIGGVVAGVAISLFGAVLSFLPISGLAVTVLGVIGIMTISYLSSFIDANRVSNINNIISSVIR